ncbi:MAG: NAD-dependent epimerase/dehydratase family protein [Myxococcota bacterium]
MNRERTLVTGAAGFVGSHLVPALRAAGREVIGVHLPGMPPGAADVEWRACDLRERGALARLAAEVQPREVVHLAALAAPAEVERAPLEALRSNFLALDSLLAALASRAGSVRLLFVSTGEVYGPSAVEAAPRREGDALRPINLYAATKAAGEVLVQRAVARDRLDAVIARPFNHTGPGRPALYAESSFAEQIARIERGQHEPVLRVGNLDPVRDFSDVRDVVGAYLVLLARGARGATYNVCSGVLRSLRSVLERLLARSSARPRIEVDPERYRPLPPESLAFAGDASRMRALGWAPTHSVDAALDALLDAYRGAA